MPNEILTRAIDAVASGEHLTADHAEAVLDEIMGGRAGEVQAGAFLIALRTKGETVPELIGLARAMRSLAAPVTTSREDLVDTCGTGGGPSTFNVSTAAGLVAAAAGCAVAKHGNRSNTSKCGSADLLEALGVKIELTPEQVGECLDQLGFGFMFAPRHHAAMANVAGVRRELGVRTVFNFLGPLTNPAGARRQLLGIADRHFQETVAEALAGLGSERALVVSAADGLDELSITVPTRVIEVEGGRTREWFLEPAEFGLGPDGPGRIAADTAAEIAGGTPAENAAAVHSVLAGEPGPRRDLVLLNAGAAIYVAGAADGIAAGIARAGEAIDSGAASTLVERLVELTNR
ncbi:MAG TPA: anthranilate phosphoribosyltransferase [Solirubrobacterales bacterium]|nr:anthranilate phosphoribosyltransferase [Solirubrobacterales bacterium]